MDNNSLTQNNLELKWIKIKMKHGSRNQSESIFLRISKDIKKIKFSIFSRFEIRGKVYQPTSNVEAVLCVEYKRLFV